MKIEQPSVPRFAQVPEGRLLYAPSDVASCVVVRNDRSRELWIVEEGWTARSEAAGPFDPRDALRALRLANTCVPEGCRLGPWRGGISLFNRSRLPGHAGEWTIVDLATLPPSISRYEAGDMGRVANEGCCAAPRDLPRVSWVVGGERSEGSAPEELVRARCPEVPWSRVGILARPWNVHPVGSPIVSVDEELGGAFVIVDLPPG